MARSIREERGREEVNGQDTSSQRGARTTTGCENSPQPRAPIQLEKWDFRELPKATAAEQPCWSWLLIGFGATERVM